MRINYQHVYSDKQESPTVQVMAERFMLVNNEIENDFSLHPVNTHTHTHIPTHTPNTHTYSTNTDIESHTHLHICV